MLLLDTVSGTIYSTRSYLLYCSDKGYEIAETKPEEHCLGNGMEFAMFIFMPRKPRIEFDRAVYHVMSRSNRQALYLALCINARIENPKGVKQ